MLVSQEFVKLLAIMKEYGADPHAKVDKLEFYRKLDAHKKQLIYVAEQRAAGQVVEDVMLDDIDDDPEVDDPTAKSITNFYHKKTVAKAGIKTRSEVVAEQNYEQRAKKQRRRERKRRKAGKNGDVKKDDADDAKEQIKKQLREFYAKQKFTPSFETKDGRRVEIEYSKEYGQQNAMHLIMRNPHLWVVQYFLNELDISFDEADFQGRTPFSIGIDYQIRVHE